MLPLGMSACLLLALLLQTKAPVATGADTEDAASHPGETKPAAAACPRQDPEDQKWTTKWDHCGSCLGDYKLWQPCHVRARAGESVTLPCTFDYAWGNTRDTRVSWRVGAFHSRVFLLNVTEEGSRPVHANFSERVSLVGDLRARKDTSVRILDLREEDSNLYFCRVSVQREGESREAWQGVRGTNLTVTAGGAAQQPPSGLLAPVLGAAGILTAVALLWLGLLVARRRGAGQRPSPAARTAECKGTAKEKPRGEAGYEEMGAKGAKAPQPGVPAPRSLPPVPEESGLLYAALALSEAEDKKKVLPVNVQREAGPETIYAAVRQ